MEKTPEDCIFCGEPAGSAEHLTLAALGGLRTDKGILCGGCNQKFSSLDLALAKDMRPLNAAIGVRHGRTREPMSTTVVDAGTGRKFILTNGGHLEHDEPLVLKDETVDGVRTVYAVTSTQHQADEFVRQMKASGKATTVTSRERVPLALRDAADPLVGLRRTGHAESGREGRAQPLRAPLSNDGARAVARTLKRYIQEGSPTDSYVTLDYAAPSPPLPADTFRFQHRFVLALDAATGLVYARASLLGVAELAIELGRTTIHRSETLVHDVDVLATRAPDDIRVQRFSKRGSRHTARRSGGSPSHLQRTSGRSDEEDRRRRLGEGRRQAGVGGERGTRRSGF